MKVFVAALVLVAVCVLLMSVGVLMRRGFPKYDLGSNEKLRGRGIVCFGEEDAALHRGRGRKGLPAGCDGNYSEACRDCNLFGKQR